MYELGQVYFWCLGVPCVYFVGSICCCPAPAVSSAIPSMALLLLLHPARGSWPHQDLPLGTAPAPWPPHSFLMEQWVALLVFSGQVNVWVLESYWMPLAACWIFRKAVFDVQLCSWMEELKPLMIVEFTFSCLPKSNYQYLFFCCCCDLIGSFFNLVQLRNLKWCKTDCLCRVPQYRRLFPTGFTLNSVTALWEWIVWFILSLCTATSRLEFLIFYFVPDFWWLL